MYAVRRQTLSNITSKQEFTDGFKKGNENTTGGNESVYPNDTEHRERYSPAVHGQQLKTLLSLWLSQSRREL